MENSKEPVLTARAVGGKTVGACERVALPDFKTVYHEDGIIKRAVERLLDGHRAKERRRTLDKACAPLGRITIVQAFQAYLIFLGMWRHARFFLCRKPSRSPRAVSPRGEYRLGYEGETVYRCREVLFPEDDVTAARAVDTFLKAHTEDPFAAFEHTAVPDGMTFSQVLSLVVGVTSRACGYRWFVEEDKEITT